MTHELGQCGSWLNTQLVRAATKHATQHVVLGYLHHAMFLALLPRCHTSIWWCCRR